MISLFQVIILGIVQGAAEMLPVSSSAHVIVAEKLMGISPAGPQAMFLLAMLHTGTMFSVLVYFWRSWKEGYFSSLVRFKFVAWRVIAATALTGAVGFGIIKGIEKAFLRGTGSGDIEELSNNLFLVACALAAAGVLILYTGIKIGKSSPASASRSPETTPRTGAAPIQNEEVALGTSCLIGIAQGLCLPFRGLSRSGTTISIGMLAGAGRRPAEEFSFALAIVITPAVIVREFMRLHKAFPNSLHDGTLGPLLTPGLIGLVASFAAGLVALKLLSDWLEEGRWQFFGYYCLAAAAGILALQTGGI
jgi:undecaprenyl-diphosphatase